MRMIGHGRGWRHDLHREFRRGSNLILIVSFDPSIVTYLRCSSVIWPMSPAIMFVVFVDHVLALLAEL